MKRLFNETFESYNEDGMELSKNIRDSIKKTFEYMCKNLDFSINDVEKIFMDEVSLMAAECRLMKGIHIRMKDREYNEKV